MKVAILVLMLSTPVQYHPRYPGIYGAPGSATLPIPQRRCFYYSDGRTGQPVFRCTYY